MLRFSILTIAATGALASVAAALPPQTAGGAGARASSVRARCTNCGSARDSLLTARLEQLSMKTDSLRWQIDNVRMSQAERARVTSELSNTVLAFKATLDELMDPRQQPALVVVGPGSAQARARTTTASPRIAIAPGVTAVESWKPRGYLGVTFDGQPADEILRDGEQYIRFYQYPKIALVEPRSPAERAGIHEGDTLLALNGTDVRKEISLSRLLVPDSRITVRVRREGDAKDIRVVVGEAPEYYVRRATPLPRSAVERVGGYGVAPSVAVGPTPVAPRTPTFWFFGGGVAGARLETISEGIGKALGVREGVFVLGVSPGPAYQAGLREGDVILRAGGRTIPTVRALQIVLNEADGEAGVKLVILRERKERELTLTW